MATLPGSSYQALSLIALATVTARDTKVGERSSIPDEQLDLTHSTRKPRGVDVRGVSSRLGKSGTGCVQFTRTGVRLGQPRSVQRHLAGVRVVVAVDCGREQRSGGNRI